ncbi:MAG: NAD(P)H-hydrate dehydratase [Cyanobacteria bacterium P01_A01_bin.114]
METEMTHRQAQLETYSVTAEQMRQIESRIFAAGMPVAALMEKVAGLIVQRVEQLLRSAHESGRRVGILVGPGHNGGDALVVARELWLKGHKVMIYHPFSKRKPLTESHGNYVRSLGVPWQTSVEKLVRWTEDCDYLIDGLFGFGLARPIEGDLAAAIAALNQTNRPIISLDLPSGIHTDTGQVLGAAIKATHTLCLGLWKQAFVQEAALAYMGNAQLIDFGIPLADIQAVLGTPRVQRLTPPRALKGLPLYRSATAHKYQAGQLLLIAGSRQYAGAALLAGQGAVASGVGMLTLMVPDSLRLWLVGQLPGALVVGCTEGPQGEITALPADIRLNQYDVIACGPGLTQQATAAVAAVLNSDRLLILDADGLNILATRSPRETLNHRSAPTAITPHPGEFRRLFPEISATDTGLAAQQAAELSGATVVLKGARSAISSPQGQLWMNTIGTPALARGGSGDVLTGLLGGIAAQKVAGQEPEHWPQALTEAALGSVWWHAQTGVQLASQRSILGVDPTTLAKGLDKVIGAYAVKDQRRYTRYRKA